jgi:2-polyprenyl-3-methyl-5-hydroxy-6-metoxy-1,4-benzoquinol methylase
MSTAFPATDRTIEDREAAHHDDWAASVDPADVDVDAAWLGLGCPELRWIDEQLGDVRGLRVLELGPGLGEASVWFARHGAEVTALDISPGMLEVVQQVAQRYGVVVETVVASASDLSWSPDASFDIVYGANVLHHVDLEACLGEVHRVLKPGGRAAFWDPVKYNPAIEVYRRLATGVRTDDEHPLRTRDLRAMRARFRSVECRGFWLTALLIFVRFFVIDRIHPSADRYWRLVIERQHRHERFLRRAHRIDSRVLRVVPPLRWMCWNLAVVCTR